MGAPQSQPIADRFHLVVNLSATVERVLEQRSRELILPRSIGGLPNHSLRQSAMPTSRLQRRRRNLRSLHCGGNGAWNATKKWLLCSSQDSHRRPSAAPSEFNARPFAADAAAAGFQNASRRIGRRRK